MKKYRLQLLSHGEIFNSREDAMRYINNNFKRYALWAEPAIVYYENEDGELRMILTVGATQDPDHKRIYIMDDGELREIVNNSNNIVNEFAGQVATISEDLQSTINAAGLELDENKIDNRVEYKPNINDDVIKNSTTLAEAIEAVSAYAQEVMEFAEETKKHDVVYKPRNAEHNVKVTITEPEDDGDGNMISLVSADVKVSEDEYNMLQIRDNRLFVPTISGSATSSTNTDVIDDANGGKTIKTTVNLSSDNSITIKEGGLSANVDFDVNQHSNTITFTVGETVKTFALPGINVIDRIEYDSENNDIIIYYYTSDDIKTTIRIPLTNVFDFEDITEAIDAVNQKIDDEITNRTNADTDINIAISEINDNIGNIEQQIIATRTGAGLNTSNGSYVSNQATNYIKNATSLKDADEKLDNAIKINRDELETLIDANVQSLSDTINAIANDTESPSSNYRLNVRLTAAEGDIDNIENTLANGIELRKVDEDNPRLFGLFVNGVQHGSVVIPEDQDKFLSSVRYDEANHTLIFVWNNDAQTETTIPIDNLMDIYTAGNGINITNNAVSVALLDNEPYLEFSEHGLLKTKGIDESIADAVNEVDNRLDVLSDSIANDYATKDELSSKADADNVYTKAEAQEKLSSSNTVSIDTVNGETTANVRIKTTLLNDPNVIKADTDGLFVNVYYNAATNTLTFNDKDIQLTSHTIVENGYYDSTNNEIVLVLKDSSSGSEETKEIRIPVGNLIEDIIKVEDTTTVNLEMSGSGDKTLTATVKISEVNSEDLYDQRENALIPRNDGLFVSKYADKYNAYLNGQYNNIVTVQEYLDSLSASIASLQEAIQNLTQRVTNIESIISVLVPDGEEFPDLIDYGERIAKLETMVGDYNDYQGDNDPTNDGWDNNTF